MERGEEEERRELSPTGVSTSTNPWREGGREGGSQGREVGKTKRERGREEGEGGREGGKAGGKEGGMVGKREREIEREGRKRVMERIVCILQEQLELTWSVMSVLGLGWRGREDAGNKMIHKVKHRSYSDWRR